jgi:hypothetical protein
VDLDILIDKIASQFLEWLETGDLFEDRLLL